MTKKASEWPEDVVKGWIKSPLHKKNMLNPRFRYLGVGIAPCRDNVAYAAQVFSSEPGKERSTDTQPLSSLPRKLSTARMRVVIEK